MCNICFTKNQQEFLQVQKIRHQVFVKEQKIPSSLEQDSLDQDAKHIIVYYNNQPAGCARLRQVGNKIKIERLAILKKFRKLGLATQLVIFAINYAQEQKTSEIYLHAQHYVANLYQKLNFKSRGQPFDFANIKHIEMYLPL